MKWQVSLATFFFLQRLLLAQLVPNADATASIPNAPNANQPAENNERVVSLTGRLALEDGSAPPDRGLVILRCSSTERARAYAEPNGSFTMQVRPSETSLDQHLLRESKSIESWPNCDLRADVAGYRSQDLRLTGHPEEILDVGTLVLHPISSEHAATVSVTTLAAPEKAKKAFAKGQEQEKKGKWASACDYFKRAIQEYPRYTLAWLELGRMQVKQNSFAEAQNSFRQAVAQDSHFLDGYAELARLAIDQKQWNQLADATDHILQFSPDSALYWFLNAAAHLNLGDVQQAEISATRALRLDGGHKVPQLEFLYAMILARRQEYTSAIQHLQTYLHLSPQAQDAQEAERRLAEFQKLVQAKDQARC